MCPPRDAAAAPCSRGALGRLRLLTPDAGGGQRTAETILDFVLLRGVYLIISHLVAQKMFNPSIFLSSGFFSYFMNYIFSLT